MTASSAMAVLLPGMTEASWAVERAFTEIRLNYDLFVPDADDWVLVWGSRLLFDPYDADTCSSTP
ncbi:hypothetical protein MCBG_02035 [Micromonospora sp. M42]|nr:hypothetical protein MCBG_02035 [Micromonospora sp. M42]